MRLVPRRKSRNPAAKTVWVAPRALEITSRASPAVERRHQNLGPDLERRLRIGRPRHVEEALAAREKERPPVVRLALRLVELGRRGRRSARGGHAHQALVVLRREDDRAVLAPARASRLDHVGELARGRRARRRLDGLELAPGEETDRAAVGRPEWKDRFLPAGHRVRFERVHVPDPEAVRAVRFVRAEGESAAVGRECHASDVRAQGVEVGVRRRRKIGAQDRESRRRAHAAPASPRTRRRRDPRRRPATAASGARGGGPAAE